MKRTLFEVEIKMADGSHHFIDKETELEGFTNLDGKQITLELIQSELKNFMGGLRVPGMYDKKREWKQDEEFGIKPEYNIPGFSTIYARGVVGIIELYEESEA